MGAAVDPAPAPASPSHGSALAGRYAERDIQSHADENCTKELAKREAEQAVRASMGAGASSDVLESCPSCGTQVLVSKHVRVPRLDHRGRHDLPPAVGSRASRCWC